jgi:hypothetical protein
MLVTTVGHGGRFQPPWWTADAALVQRASTTAVPPDPATASLSPQAAPPSLVSFLYLFYVIS